MEAPAPDLFVERLAPWFAAGSVYGAVVWYTVSEGLASAAFAVCVAVCGISRTGWRWCARDPPRKTLRLAGIGLIASAVSVSARFW